MEVWLEIEEAPQYLVSSLGRVYNRITNYELHPTLDKYGYPRVTLMSNGRRIYRCVHRLVAITFFDWEDDGCLEVNHIDGDKTNNYIWNLEWVTQSENTIHAIRLGLNKYASRIPEMIEINKIPVRIIETGEVFNSIIECANYIDADPSTIGKVLKNNGINKTCKGFTFSYVD